MSRNVDTVMREVPKSLTRGYSGTFFNGLRNHYSFSFILHKVSAIQTSFFLPH
ncbi:MAG: hypothetical protein WBA13_07235 [Microcoleaceae cyanobacterium]